MRGFAIALVATASARTCAATRAAPSSAPRS